MDYFTAIASDNITLIKQLMLKKIRCSCVNQKGLYPIHMAACLGHLEMLKLFVSYDPENVDLKDIGLRTPLFWASLKGHIKCVIHLLNNGADTEEQDQLFLTPLLAALVESHGLVARVLVSYGANIHVTDLVGYSPLHYAVTIGNVQLVKELIEEGCEIDAVDVDNWTPFYMGVLYEKYNVLPLLVSRGAGVNIKDNTGTTPLMRAAYDKNVKMVGWLIKNVPNICF